MKRSPMKTIALGSLAAIAAFAVTAPAFAQSTQDSIKSCRAQLANEQMLDMDNYRLKFKSSKGTRTKTLMLEAVPHDGGDRIDVVCKVSRGGKVEVSLPQAS
jgi:hypothetical protein